MTTIELSRAIGQKVVLEDHGLQFICTVKDAKTAYGSVRLQITPIGGSGLRWVEFSSVRPYLPSSQIIREQPRAAQPQYSTVQNVRDIATTPSRELAAPKSVWTKLFAR